MAFQINIKGLEGTTTTYNDITTETNVLDFKKMVKANADVEEVEPEHMRLIFAGKQLEDNQTLGQYGVTANSTLHLVFSRYKTFRIFFGGVDETRHDPNDDVELTDEPDMITFDADPDDLRVKMSCGHAIGRESLTVYCKMLVTEGDFQFFCPYVDPENYDRCHAEWKYIDIRKICPFTDEDREYFESKISENYSLRSLGTLKCPQCSSYCERKDKSRTSVICLICSRKPGAGEFAFCKHCLQEVKKSRGYRCDNDFCGGIDPRLAILKNAEKKQIGSVPGVPSFRACPKCGRIIEHDSACKHMSCPCGQNFCFVCLSLYEQLTGWSCGSSSTVCDIAPTQKILPGL